MPASGPHPRSHGPARRLQIDAPERAHPFNTVVAARGLGCAMDAIEHADQEPEPISVARCRELLGDDAAMMSDEEVVAVARHAETLAHILLVVALQDTRVH